MPNDKNARPTPLKTANIDPVHARVIADFKAPRKAQSLSDYYKSWNDRANAMDEDTAPRAGIPKIDAKDLGATLGPVMTEAQFLEYRRNQEIPRVADMYNAYHEKKRDAAGRG